MVGDTWDKGDKVKNINTQKTAIVLQSLMRSVTLRHVGENAITLGQQDVLAKWGWYRVEKVGRG